MVQVLCPVVVGREAELQAIGKALDDALAGQGRCVVLVGEPGIGKSRLARELAAEASRKGALFVGGRGVPEGASIAYRPLSAAVLQALRGKSLPDDAEFGRWIPALSAILPGAGIADAGSGEASAVVRGEALLQLLRRLAEPDGLVLSLEDLHWADPDTVALLEYLMDNLAREPILLVLTTRTSPSSPLLDVVRRQRGSDTITHLELHPLDADDVRAMALACAPDATEGLLQRIQNIAEGVPLLVEELLASPGLPKSLADTVRERLASLTQEGLRVIHAAAVLGRHFDWEFLPAMTGLAAQAVTEALTVATGQLLVVVERGTFRFRHALTREAVLADMFPPLRADLAARGLDVVEAAHPSLEEPWRELAVELAVSAGDIGKASRLLTATGRALLMQGALATAAQTLRRAADLQPAEQARAEPALLLVEALALAGRVEEAAAIARKSLAAMDDDRDSAKERAEIHVRVAQAAIAGGRWEMAAENVTAARALLTGNVEPALRARIAVAHAHIALARDDSKLAERRAQEALSVANDLPEVRCEALEILGRLARYDDLPAARQLFEQALLQAETAHLQVWRLRALHELGTIDMFEHLEADRLLEARRDADRLGALSTAAVLDLQLAALSISRWQPDGAAAHAQSAVQLAEGLRLTDVRAKALLLLAESHALRGDRRHTSDYVALARVAGRDDPAIEGFCLGAMGEAALVTGDREAAMRDLAGATDILGRLPHAEPAAFRALWPLLLASSGSEIAATELSKARRLGVDGFSLNRGLLGYAEAAIAAKAGDSAGADELARAADPAFQNGEAWCHLARLVVAGSALGDRWGEPRRWLADAAAAFHRQHLPALAMWAEQLLEGLSARLPSTARLTAREVEVLQLISAGLSNREIAGRLTLSIRTVEKHVEALLRKMSARSRTQLAVMAADAGVRGGGETT